MQLVLFRALCFFVNSSSANILKKFSNAVPLSYELEHTPPLFYKLLSYWLFKDRLLLFPYV